MQLRRFGLLLPLALSLSGLTTGCCRQSAGPAQDSEQTLQTASPIPPEALAVEAKSSSLQLVTSPPRLQHLPVTGHPGEASGEIVQARYRPPEIFLPETSASRVPQRIEFARAQDYSWLQGELLFSSVRGVWRLRYAASDDDDPYGGSVTLQGLSSELAMEVGQRVRVEGKLINAGSSEPSPCYQVSHLELLSVP